MMHPREIKNILKTEAENLNITEHGTVDVEDGSVFICLFPYYIKNMPSGNLSRYAVVADYHKICIDYLRRISADIETECEVYADVSPFNEVELAIKAGLGVRGKNRLLINKKYGSYVFIGLIFIKGIFFGDTKDVGEMSCANCGRCIKACPLGAIGENRFEKKLCLSHITQKKGELSETEKAAIVDNGKIWGCDICSEVCVHNKNIEDTPIREFYDIMPNLKKSDIEGLSSKQFKEKYADRAFTWRGKNVLMRNLDLFEDN